MCYYTNCDLEVRWWFTKNCGIKLWWRNITIFLSYYPQFTSYQHHVDCLMGTYLVWVNYILPNEYRPKLQRPSCRGFSFPYNVQLVVLWELTQWFRDSSSFHLAALSALVFLILSIQPVKKGSEQKTMEVSWCRLEVGYRLPLTCHWQHRIIWSPWTAWRWKIEPSFVPRT